MQLSRQDEPVYRELADILRRELADYQAGDFLPAEVQLAERFGVNRHTLRRATSWYSKAACCAARAKARRCWSAR